MPVTTVGLSKEPMGAGWCQALPHHRCTRPLRSDRNSLTDNLRKQLG